MAMQAVQACLKQLWLDGQLCDCTVEGIPAHRVVLAANSGYFKALFTGAGTCMTQGQSSGQQAVQLHGVDREALPLLLEAIYSSGDVQITPDNLESLLSLANFLDVRAVQEACWAYMRGALSLSTAVPLFILASRHLCGGLRAELVRATPCVTVLAAPGV